MAPWSSLSTASTQPSSGCAGHCWTPRTRRASSKRFRARATGSSGPLEVVEGEPAGLTPGTIISHYRILAECGRGAMGVVYKAEDTNLGRMVALKFLPDELATHPPALERLRREARMIAALKHPGIRTIDELGESSGRVFLVMEFLEGETLRTRGKLSESELIDIAVQVAKSAGSSA